jgi:hypothetical protein
MEECKVKTRLKEKLEAHTNVKGKFIPVADRGGR